MGAEDGRSSGPRFVLYSQDGFGLGHMRRTNSIASCLLSVRPDAAVLTLADSLLGPFFETNPHHDYLKLPSIVKVGPGDWRPVKLPLPLAELRDLRSETIRSAVLAFRPDAVLVDHMPHGALGELVPTLEALEASGSATTMVLGLRDIIDAPPVVRRQWQVEGAYAAITRHYDAVLVYGERRLFDAAAQYGLHADLAAKVRYCGYVCTPATASHPDRTRHEYLAGTEAGTRLIVAMAGGGADGYPMMRALLDALPAVASALPCVLVLVVGPFLPARLGQDLRDRAEGLPVVVRTSVSDLLSHVEAADLTVTMAGYNSVTEILRSGRPAVVVPRAGPSAEQRLRAGILARHGWLDVVDPDELAPEVVARAVVDGLTRGRPQVVADRPALDGAAVAVDHLLSLLPAPMAEPGPPHPEVSVLTASEAPVHHHGGRNTHGVLA